MNEWHVVSFSGGKDSTAMLLRMLELNMRVDEVLFCDTGVEFPQMYEHVDKVEKYIGRPITRLKSDKPYEYYLLEHQRTRGKYIGAKGYGWARVFRRWCTKYLKTANVKKHLGELEKTHEVKMYTGIAADEQKRIKDKIYPLVEWGWTEADALQYCYEKGFDWGGLYKIFHRVSCWCCPLQSLDECRKLRKHFPALWEQLRAWDRVAWNDFRNDYTVEQLEEKFHREDEWEKMQMKLFEEEATA